MIDSISEPLAAVALWTAINLAFMLLLGFNVVRVRLRESVTFGTAGNVPTERAVRAHGNNTEYVPGILLCLMLLALFGESALQLHVAGGLLLLARLLHVIGIQQVEKDLPPARLLGNFICWSIFIWAIVKLLVFSL